MLQFVAVKTLCSTVQQSVLDLSVSPYTVTSAMHTKRQKTLQVPCFIQMDPY